MVRGITTIFFVVMIAMASYGQKWDDEMLCDDDTLTIVPERTPRHLQGKGQVRGDEQPYKAVLCRKPSKWGYRIDIGGASFNYGPNTTAWLGNHGSLQVSFVLVYDHFNLGFRFKPYTINPGKEIRVNGIMVPASAKVNPVKLDYYLGYSIDITRRLAVEPYLGYNRSIFHVINEDELQQHFTFDEARGLIAGSTFNWYFLSKKFEFLTLYVTAGYSFADFARVSSQLDRGYFEWGAGIAVKGFFSRRFYLKSNILIN